MTHAADPVRARLAWRCRRGMQELDVLLLRWLEARFERAGAAERAQFEALLELPDPSLARYLLGGARPAQPQMAALVSSILSTSDIMLPCPVTGNLPPASGL